MDRYIPNEVPASERWLNVGLSLLLVGWGSFGLWADDLLIPTKRGNAIHLHGIAAGVMFGAIVAAVINLLSVVIDHFDIRNNELAYRRVAFFSQLVGWVLFATAILIELLR